MKARTVKKILKNKSHPKREHLIRQMTHSIESYGKMACRRLGLDQNRWGIYALDWPKRISGLIGMVRS